MLAGSALTHAAASHLLISDEALAAVDRLPVEAASPSADPVADRKQAVLEDQLSKALVEQAASEAAQRRKRITANNIFCPSCRVGVGAGDGAGVGAGVGAGAGAGAGETASGEPLIPATELPLALLATMEADDPLASLATILDTEREATGVFGLDDQIRAGVFVVGIRAGVVTLRQDQAIAVLDFSAPERPKPAAKQAPPTKGSREIEGASDAIDCQGDACTVDRKFVDKLLANPQLLMKQGKFLPAVKDGETRGFRVLRVRKGSLPQILGLRNGDTLLSVNGTELDSMDRAMGLYTKLRRASELSLTVERKGKVIQKQISIR